MDDSGKVTARVKKSSVPGENAFLVGREEGGERVWKWPRRWPLGKLVLKSSIGKSPEKDRGRGGTESRGGEDPMGEGTKYMTTFFRVLKE